MCSQRRVKYISKYFPVGLYATCNLYAAIWSALIAPIPYYSTGKHFLTTSSHLIVSEISEELSKTSYATALNFFILSSTSIVNSFLLITRLTPKYLIPLTTFSSFIPFKSN